MLRADVVVVGPFCFFLGEGQNLLGSLSETLERGHLPLSLGPGGRVGAAPPRLLELSRSAPAGLNPLCTYPGRAPPRRPLYSRKSRSLFEREVWRSLRNAVASI